VDRSFPLPPVDAEPAFEPDDPAFQADPKDFPKKRPPAPGDWLARFKERTVGWDEYVKSRPVMRTGRRRAIVIQPIGDFTEEQRQLLEKVREFTGVFFDTTTRIEAPVAFLDHGWRTRREDGRTWTQYHTVTLMQEVLRPRLPADAICYIGVTMSDLYPEEGWNLVFGQATLEQRVGIYSLARFLPVFTGERDTPETRRRVLTRGFKLLAHETGHMFSLEHCARYECLMNGTNSLEETDRSVTYLCPVCLKNLQWNLRFDVRKRYRGLQEVYGREGMSDAAKWIERRLVRIGPGPNRP